MSLTEWLKGCFSHRGKALSLYRAGMAKAKKRDYGGAIEDYSAAIEASAVPNDVKAMSLYNRALAYSAIAEHTNAAEDLAAVLEMPSLPENIRKAATDRRERIRRREEKRPNS